MLDGLLTQVRAVPVSADFLELLLVITVIAQRAAHRAAALADLVSKRAGLSVQVGKDVALAGAAECDGFVQFAAVYCEILHDVHLS